MLLVASLAFARDLRVCADPDNLPYSNQRSQGFENRIAELIARELHVSLDYVWSPERKSFVKNTLQQGRCDVILGLPSGFPGVLSTAPYYRSSYVFVSRKSEPPVTSFDDPRLRSERIGLHIVGNDYAPPGFALARRGIVANVHGYSLFDDDGPASIVDAVANQALDVAIVWGPIAGYRTRAGHLPLAITPVPDGMPNLPLAYSISAAVRPTDRALGAEIDGALARRKEEIGRLLEEYGVPQVR